MSPGTAIPLWLSQILPKWFCDRPAFTEAIWSGLVSLSKQMVTMLCALWVAFDVVTPQEHQNLGSFWLFIQACWFAVVMPILWSAMNGNKAASKATAAIEQQNGNGTKS